MALSLQLLSRAAYMDIFASDLLVSYLKQLRTIVTSTSDLALLDETTQTLKEIIARITSSSPPKTGSLNSMGVESFKTGSLKLDLGGLDSGGRSGSIIGRSPRSGSPAMKPRNLPPGVSASDLASPRNSASTLSVVRNQTMCVSLTLGASLLRVYCTSVTYVTGTCWHLPSSLDRAALCIFKLVYLPR